jgi:ABC-type multidrug transport system ATPase subunit
MFRCDNLEKRYNSSPVFSNFSFIFPEIGFVLLHGESGCGKTTLLNILAGLIPFDKGFVIFQGEKYEDQVNMSVTSKYIGYITQDVHFIDYLTVLDNLKLCSINDDIIIEHLRDFGLLELKDSFPSTLSGGERQRLAILQALLAEKEIIILDEPTSALDGDNKRLVFETLEKLKDKKLIICSSHDKEAKAYADRIIDFNNLSNTDSDTELTEIIFGKKEMRKRKLSPFFNKWYSFKGREKKSKVHFLLVIILAVIALCLCDTPTHKFNSNIEYTYKLNQFRVQVSKETEPLLDEIINEAVEAPLIYNRSVPYEVPEDINDPNFVDPNYDIDVHTLPFKKEAFKLSSRIKYGTYFTQEDQIILSWENAVKIGSPERLVGKTMRLNLYDQDYNLEIAGIFDQLTKNEQQYLRSSGITYDEYDGNYFLNGEFTKRYIKDKDFYDNSGNRTYVLYFDSFSSMKKAYDHYSKTHTDFQFTYAEVSSISVLFAALFAILLPIVLVIIPVSVLFYYQTQKIETAYSKHIFSVYQYLGYPYKIIKRCHITGNLLETLKIIVKALMVAFPIMIITNLINSHFVFIPFQIFTFNAYLILALILLVGILSVILSFRTIKHVEDKGWYSVLIEHRDLL